jgi:hypothetical protein
MGLFFGGLREQLILWVRQAAWLATAPDKVNPKDKSEPVSRLKSAQTKDDPLLWPENPAPYLTDWLFEIGPTASGAMGEAPMAIRHIEADLAALGIETEPWECRLLRRLSGAYAEERYRARKPECPAPYSGIEDRPEAVRAKATGQFRAMFKSLLNRK